MCSDENTLFEEECGCDRCPAVDICHMNGGGLDKAAADAIERLMAERDKAIEERDIVIKCNNDLMRLIDETVVESEQFKQERDAAVKCAQRFSYCNERKCRWCRFGFLDEDKEWDCDHPLKDTPCKGNPFAYPCRRFEYVYREENAK